jgi:hypothetical protein
LSSAFGLDLHDEVADIDLVRRLQDERARDLAPVDVSTVRASQIDDDELAVFEQDPGMSLRDVSLGQDDVIALDSPDGDFRLVKAQLLLFTTFFSDDQRKHVSSSRKAIVGDPTRR